MSITNPTKPKKSATPFFFALAFLIGVLSTAVAMRIFRRPAPPSPVASAEKGEATGEDAERGGEAGENAEAGEASGTDTVRLTPEGEKTADVRVETISYRSVREGLRVSATVESSADRVAKITPPAAGKVVRMLVRLGDTVRAGQPLAVLDSFDIAQARAAVSDAQTAARQAEAAIPTAQAELAQARTRAASAVRALRTQQELARAGAFAQAPLLAAQNELTAARAELAAAEKEDQAHDVILARTERLFAEGIVSKSELEEARLHHAEDQIRLAKARSQVDIAQKGLAREQRITGQGLTNRQAVQTAEAEVRAAEGEVARALRQEQATRTSLAGARQRVASARSNLSALEGVGRASGGGGQLTLLAPLDGVVAAQQVTVGEAVERSTTLFEIENLSAVVVQANVPEKDMARVRVGQRIEVTVAAFPRERFGGVVQSLASRVDEKTRTLPVRCLVSNPERRLRPEMFATVTLPVGDSRRTLAVPEAAVVTDREEDGSEAQVVFVATAEEGEYVKRRVTLGKSVGSLIAIASGLKDGERVVVSGAYTLLSETKKGDLKDED